MRRLYSTLFWLFVCASSIVLYPLAAVLCAATAPFDPRRRAVHQFSCFWASLYTWLNPAWPVRIEGRERIRRDEAYVMVANHLSLIDILVLFRLFTHFKWVSKTENFRVPFIGWNMRLNRYIELRRGDRASVRQMMQACRDALAAGSSIMMFPEGTRSPDGQMRRFREGAFTMAQDAGVAVVPIVIDGTHDALPKSGILLRQTRPTPITVRVLPPVPPDAAADAEELTALVHDKIKSELTAIRAEKSAAELLDR